jgi:aminoglycoside phosphotransferase (APT) family kinase protein
VSVAQSPVGIDGDAGEGLVDVAAVEAWLDRNAPRAGAGPLTARKISGGSSNAVFLLERGATQTVLRRPPRVPRPDSEKILGREARVLRALNGTDVPAPRMIAHCDDPAVNGVAFYVMSYVPGWVSMGGEKDFPAPYNQAGPARDQLAFQLVEGIARLAKVDYRAVGLEGFGKPDDFLQRQVDRWLHQLQIYRETETYQGRDLPGLAYVSDWLRDNVVATPRAGIIHGDYGFANAIFAHGPEARLAAMVDWELSTVGDPLLDLGWVAYGFRSRRDPPGEASSGYFDAALFPPREDLCEAYAERTGLPLDNLDYYLVLAQFKLAVLLERKWAEAQAGRRPQAYGDLFGDMVLKLLRQAEATARTARLG